MSDDELIHQVALMREQQRAYSKSKPYTAQRQELLESCKRLEAKVDAAIKERNHKRQREEQPELF